MKILHLLDETWDSGLAAYALDLAALLQKSGQDVALGVRTGQKPEAMARERNLKTYPLNNIWDLRKILMTQPWDVVNAHTGRTHSWAVLARLGRCFLKPCFSIVRTRGDARALNTNIMFRWMYRRTEGVIAASEHVRQQYLNGLGLDENRVHTIYPAVRIDEPVAPYPGVVGGMIGRLDVVKGHSVLLEAAARVAKLQPKLRVRIAGKEAGIPLQLLQNQAEELGLSSQVEFLGYVPSSADFMRSCSFGVISSIGSEEVSRACLEWMGAGRPVVGTLVGCLPELIEPEESGLLVPPGDSVALAEAILRLIRDPNIIIRWGVQARVTALKKFSPETLVNKTLEVYERALGKEQGRHGNRISSNRSY